MRDKSGWKRGWQQSVSPEARRDRRRRITLIEGSFGQATVNHHFKRARWRRLWRQQIQDYLIAAVQNVKKIVRAVWDQMSAAAAATTAAFSTLKTIFAATAPRNDFADWGFGASPLGFSPLFLPCCRLSFEQ